MTRPIPMANRSIKQPGPAPYPDMAWIPGGTFLMGSNQHYPEEVPVHRVTVDGFWMDRYTVTNEQFAHFVSATGYVTVAERPLNPTDYPGVDPEQLLAGSLVFQQPDHPVDLHDFTNWWSYIPGANWRHPEGPASSIDCREHHPVVQVAYEDVEAYARWIGKTIPTEADWERAARGGLQGATYTWGDELTMNGKFMANTWQGEFPWQNLCLDGYAGTSPVGSFPANGYGLYDMAGNVWEWTSDWYTPRHPDDAAKPCCIPLNPHSAAVAKSFDPVLPVPIPRKVLKGGSYLCAPNYCLRYRPAARIPQMIDTATCHIGFRCIVRTAA